MNSRASKNIAHAMAGDEDKMSNPMKNEMKTMPMHTKDMDDKMAAAGKPLKNLGKFYAGGVKNMAQGVAKGVKKMIKRKKGSCRK